MQCHDKAIYQPLILIALRTEHSLTILFHKRLSNRVFSTIVWSSNAKLWNQRNMVSNPNITTYQLYDLGEAAKLSCNSILIFWMRKQRTRKDKLVNVSLYERFTLHRSYKE